MSCGAVLPVFWKTTCQLPSSLLPCKGLAFRLALDAANLNYALHAIKSEAIIGYEGLLDSI